MSDILEQKQKLEQLMLSEDLEELNNRTNQFNVFNALKLQNNEIRHSNFLGWLMTPYENHELGDYFLKEFLKSAIKNFSSSEKTEIDLKDVAFTNFSDAEIRREYKNIDILIISPKNEFLCIVENKIWTGEHDNQLSRYADIVNKEFNGYKKLYIFLTPEIDIECELIKRDIDTTKSVHYIPMCYRQVYEVINKVLKFKSKHLNDEVKIFIEHYKKMIERNIMGNTDKEIVNLCRKIYRENKEAIDLINEYKNPQKELNEILREVLHEKDYIQEIVEESNADTLCLPVNINDIDNIKIGNWSNNKNFIASLKFVNFRYGYDFVWLEILLSPLNDKTNEDKYNKIVEHLKNKGLELKYNRSGWAWSAPITIITLDTYCDFNSREEAKAYISKRIDEEKSNYIDLLAEALNQN